MLFTKNVTICSSFWKKGTGLMFRFPKGDFAYVFPFKKPRSVAITMWFVFRRIDIIFLDDKGVIVETLKALRPFSNYISPVLSSTFVELPAGTIQKYLLHKGQRVKWSKKGIYFE